MGDEEVGKGRRDGSNVRRTSVFPVFCTCKD